MSSVTSVVLISKAKLNRSTFVSPDKTLLSKDYGILGFSQKNKNPFILLILREKKLKHRENLGTIILFRTSDI